MTTDTTTPTASAGMRASDAEREDTIARLHQALAEGRLDLAETDERVAAAYAARYRDELPPLLADLPHSGSAPSGAWSAAPAWTELWTSTVWRAGRCCSTPASVRRPRSPATPRGSSSSRWCGRSSAPSWAPGWWAE